MTQTITPIEAGSAFEALHQLATVVLNEHANDQGLCPACGCAFPCERAVLAEHNLTL
jgi:hypothetical protein